MSRSASHKWKVTLNVREGAGIVITADGSIFGVIETGVNEQAS